MYMKSLSPKVKHDLTIQIQLHGHLIKKSPKLWALILVTATAYYQFDQN